MRRRAEPALGERHNVILDATFLHREQRAQAIQLARKFDAKLVFVKAAVPQEELRRRILARRQRAADASEGDLAVLKHQLKVLEAMTDFEESRSVTIDNRDADAMFRLPGLVREMPSRV
jgi:predicted kinase